jgi:septal ring factor EnvC (AmiA/AmiB activator)
MSDNLVLEILRAIRGDIAKLSDRLDEHGHRLGRIEMMIAGQRRDQANDSEARAALEVRVDRLSNRLERVERRLDIVSAE